MKRSVVFLTDRFNAFLLGQPGNKVLYDNSNGQNGIVKGIELKPEINNKAVGEIAVIPSSTTPSSTNNNSRSNKKK